MKFSVLIFLIFISFGALSQQTTRYFAQGNLQFNVGQEAAIAQLETDLRALPQVFIVRMDKVSNSFILMIDQTTEFTEEQLKNLFGSLSTTISCIYIGVDGVDERKVYPISNCPN